ncbi:leucine-rich repeat protein [Paenibacillus sp. PAMC21692]|uniref:leucine-rich repeat protein n=1 Tax=Paenibacillus sp. PAMC21692 TaxID=2762320 RepID=UPI00164DD6F0|nr:leucine-rich repeat protein [Paenibacillus sp. PAMC21692]QNK55859.1 leucine-rich repeat protein [Paenibacillus sp. PAMC21692]
MLRGFDWRRLLLAVGVVCSVWFVSGGATRADATLSDFSFDYYSDYAEIFYYYGTDTEIVIPETARELPVTAIGYRAFKWMNLSKVTFHERLKTIGDEAFSTNQLTEVEIPASVTYIGKFAFWRNALEKVILHEGLQTIDAVAFATNDISEIEIPASVSSMGMNAFRENGLTKLKLNEGQLEEIGYGSFSDNAITEVEIPKTVKSIAHAAFRDNALNKVILNEGLETIWYSAFENNALTAIVIPSTVDLIRGNAFYNNDLAYAVIPPSVTTIERDAFSENRPDFTIIGSPGSPAHNYAIEFNIPFIDAATIPLPDIRFAPDGQDWARTASTTVSGDDYGIFNLKYIWTITDLEPAPEAEWRSFESGDEIEQSSEGESFLHVQGFLLDRAAAWRSERFRLDRTPPTLSVEMTTGPSAAPYLNDTWNASPVTVHATASDSLGEIREIVVETEYDSQSSAAAYPGNTYSANTYSATFAANGTYQLKITAIDQAGNVSAAEQHIVKINITPPSYEKSGNAWLKELIVSTGELAPVFSGDVSEYNLRIDPDVQSITMTMLPDHALASTSLGGQALGSGRVKADISLEEEADLFEIVVTAENGTKRTYKILLERDEAELPPSEAACSKPSAFTDIAGHWGKPSIIEASCRGIVQGYSDGSFGPDHRVTRAEFTLMMAALFQWESVESVPMFGDMAGKDHWAEQAISQAANSFIVTGYPDGTFRPEATITRAEMAVMIAKALELPTDADLLSDFTDNEQIPAWAKGAVASIRQLEIVIGRGDNRFVPGGAATRAEATVMLLRIAEIKKK